MSRRRFGSIRRLPSGRWQARYTGPGGTRRKAPDTFAAKIHAEAWLADEARKIDAGLWNPLPRAGRGAPTLGEYFELWLAGRQLRPRTRYLYESLWRNHIGPDLGDTRINEITAERVRGWWTGLDTGPTAKSHAYSLLRTVLGAAEDEGLITGNPCRLRGAGSVERVHTVKVLSPTEIDALAAAMPPKLRLLVHLAGWCGLRLGELLELRRSDIDLDAGAVRVERALNRVGGRREAGPPKTRAGIRTVWYPPHLGPVIERHLAEHAAPGAAGLLFPSSADRALWIQERTVRDAWARARHAAGHNTIRIHDLRHTAAVLAAKAGASITELQARLGHSSPAAALRYQHAVDGADRRIAEALSALRQV